MRFLELKIRNDMARIKCNPKNYKKRIWNIKDLNYFTQRQIISFGMNRKYTIYKKKI